MTREQIIEEYRSQKFDEDTKPMLRILDVVNVDKRLALNLLSVLEDPESTYISYTVVDERATDRRRLKLNIASECCSLEASGYKFADDVVTAIVHETSDFFEGECSERSRVVEFPPRLKIGLTRR